MCYRCGKKNSERRKVFNITTNNILLFIYSASPSSIFLFFGLRIEKACLVSVKRSRYFSTSSSSSSAKFFSFHRQCSFDLFEKTKAPTVSSSIFCSSICTLIVVTCSLFAFFRARICSCNSAICGCAAKKLSHAASKAVVSAGCARCRLCWMVDCDIFCEVEGTYL